MTVNDAITVRLVDARTIALRASVDMPEGEAKKRVDIALAALGDAIEQRSDDLQTEANNRILGHLEVLADALEAPGTHAPGQEMTG